MQYFELMTKCACGNHAIHARSNRKTRSSRGAIEIHSLKIDIDTKW